jgi:hypothetical protein
VGLFGVVMTLVPGHLCPDVVHIETFDLTDEVVQ